jgi:hypothetical protein
LKIRAVRSPKSDTIRWSDGMTINDRTVDTSRPPITAIAMGALNSPPSPTPSAEGAIPPIMANVVMMIGRTRSEQASTIASTPRQPMGFAFDGKVQKHDGVFRHDPHQHQDTDDDGKRDGVAA